jgi:hypothetical protein
MADRIPMVLCPTCRIAVPDKDYFAHSKKHQAKDTKLPTKLPEGEHGVE